jgi:hypothetical protein
LLRTDIQIIRIVSGFHLAKKHYLCIAMTDIKYGFHPPEQGVR